MFESGFSGDIKDEGKVATAGDDEEPPTNLNDKLDTVQLAADTETSGFEAPKTGANRNGALTIEDVTENGNLLDGSKAQDTAFRTNDEKDEVNPAEARISEDTEMEVNTEPPENGVHELRASEVEKTNGASAYINGGQSPTPALQVQEGEDILHSISSLAQLEHKIVDIDGHFNSKEIGIQNPWKNFRGIRNHQDLGSLFEMREDFYVYKHPRIVKEPKRKR